MCKDEKYLRVNEMTEPLNALEMLKEFLTQSKNNDYYLKWAIIAAHNALQGFMVLALKGTSSLPVYKPVYKWKKEYNGRSAADLLLDKDIVWQLDGFGDLFKKIKSTECMQNKEFTDHSGEITNSVKDLNLYRNRFIHFNPGSWSIPIPNFYLILSDVIKVIEFLTQECTEVRRHYMYSATEHDISYIKATVDECKKLIKENVDVISNTK